MSSDQPGPSPSPHPTPVTSPPSSTEDPQPGPTQGCESTTPFPPLPTITPQPTPQSPRSSPGNHGSRRRHSIPIAFPPLFQPNASSTSLIHSTAEGKPIPVDDSTAADRTSALRQLNSHYPSRHRYAKSTGAQSSTYSQPVIVRTYPGPPPNHPASTSGQHHYHHHHRGSQPGQSNPPSAGDVVRRMIPFSSAISGPSSSPKYGMLSIARSKAKKRAQGARDDAAGNLPPLEAFTFKSFMSNIEPEEGGHSINADLDRIAEICARSRYSLSNQYEVHKAPHGSGESFLAAVSAPQNQPPQGPTLQVVSSDDERQMKHGRRRRGLRRRSVAVGTLETIMSSSRSSEEDKSKKHKSAAEIAEEVRSRAAARKESGSSSPISPVSSAEGRVSGENGTMTKNDEENLEAQQTLVRRKSVSLASAVIENTRKHENAAATIIDTTAPARSGSSPKGSGTGLVGEPARPQTSTNYLEIRPAADEVMTDGATPGAPAPTKGEGHNSTSSHREQQQGLLSNLTGWIWWRPGAAQALGKTSHAEGSLRELLRSSGEDKADVKGKGVERPL
ncbi:hypothetical protein jhhlp_006580 [Lomentospora prolificans]|uniref:Uncharacterized protein n=1 Tax=Lomentospora prolificans TaxID=41688 RepID=A0A2N3N6B5_9PEZI|nr:hypothetical protein jhhlp_006580 [Lomentospora prolificans]